LKIRFFPVEPVGRIEHKIAQGEPVSGGELLDAIEQSQGHSLPDGLRNVILKFSVSAVKRRGRPSISQGQEDFALREVDAVTPHSFVNMKKKPNKGGSSQQKPATSSPLQTKRLASWLTRESSNVSQ
jgi:hypothetical protein